MSVQEKYVVAHTLKGEGGRLRLMANCLDPMTRRHIEALGLQPGWKCLELAAGLGTVSEWLAARLGKSGHVIASDIETSLMDGVGAANLEVRTINMETDVLPSGCDLVYTRAIFHHLRNRWETLPRLVTGLKPGGVLLVIEPDFTPVSSVQPPEVAAFWQGFLRWAESCGINYMVGSELASRFAAMGLERVGAEGTLAIFSGGTYLAEYWRRGMEELGPSMVEGGFVDQASLDLIISRLQDPTWWTHVCNFTAVWGWKPLG